MADSPNGVPYNWEEATSGTLPANGVALARGCGRRTSLRGRILKQTHRQVVDDTLFSITCTTCQARLKVRSLDAIGQILSCPKCESMVQVVAPPGWIPPEPKPAVPEPPPPPAFPLPPPPPVAGEEISLPGGQFQAATDQGKTAGGKGAEASEDLVEPAAGPAVAATTVANASSADAEPAIAGPKADPSEWGLTPVGSAEDGWGRRRFLLAAIPLIGVVAAAGAWAYVAGRPELPQAASPPRKPAAVVQPAAVSPEQQPSLPIDRRWIPDQTKFYARLRLSRLQGREDFRRAANAGDALWQSSAARVFQTLSLKPEKVARLDWAAVDLKDWTRQAVVFIELGEGQDATVLRAEGEATGLEVAGQPCHQKPGASWPHPYAVLDERTIVTGPADQLGRLIARQPERLASAAIARFLDYAAADADLLMALDLGAARAADWPLPAGWFDVWPAGRDAWRVLCQTPQGIGLTLQGQSPAASELALVCDGLTVADQVKNALDAIVPAAKSGMQAIGQSLTDRLQSGKFRGEEADQYEILLTRGREALAGARWEVLEDVVWLRIDWGKDLADLVAAAIDSRAAIRTEWSVAALDADRGVHQRLITGLTGYREGEGRFPAGAAGGTLLPPETRLSWLATLLPYYDHRDWHRELEFGYSWNAPQNKAVTSRVLPEVVNPAIGPQRSEAGFPVTHYVGVAGVGADAATLPAGDPRAGVFGYNRSTRPQDIADGAANTIAVLGVSKEAGPWAAGGRPTVRALTQRPYVNGPDGFGSGQPDGMLAGMADGSVRFVSRDVDPTVLEQLATAKGAEATTVAALDAVRQEPVPPAPEAASPPPQQADAEPSATPAAAEAVAPEAAPSVPEVARREAPDWQAIETENRTRLAVKVAAIDLPERTLGDAVDLWTQLSAVPVTFDTDAMTQLGVRFSDPVRANLSEASLGLVLQTLVAGHGLTVAVERGHVLVTWPAAQRTELRSIRYSVADLAPTGDALDRLGTLIQELVAPESWQAAGGQGTLRVADGTLEIGQTGIVHGQIVVFCERLRAARRLPLRSGLPPARFSLVSRFAQGRARLNEPVTANFPEPTPLDQVARYLQHAGKMRILTNWLALAEEGIGSQEQVTVVGDSLPLGEILTQLLRPMGLAYRVVDADTLEISTAKAVESRLELEFYPAGDLTIQTSPGDLIRRLQADTAASTWSDVGGSGLARFDDGSKCLLVLQSQPVQAAVETYLAGLRAGREP